MPTNAERAMPLWQSLEDKPQGPGEWLKVEQSRINQFADATGDHQFIHVDPEQAALRSPYKVTIAHGYLTLSLLPLLSASVPAPEPKALEGVSMSVNYGLDRLRFPAPVKVGARVRAHRVLLAAELVAPNTIQLKHKLTVDIEGETKPACVAETLSRLVYT